MVRVIVRRAAAAERARQVAMPRYRKLTASTPQQAKPPHNKPV
jgi:hypothetical protein